MNNKLWTVTLELDVIVAAATDHLAEDAIQRDMREIFRDEQSNVVITVRNQIQSPDELPHGWDVSCYPYDGCRGLGTAMRTIRQYMEDSLDD